MARRTASSPALSPLSGGRRARAPRRVPRLPLLLGATATVAGVAAAVLLAL